MRKLWAVVIPFVEKESADNMLSDITIDGYRGILMKMEEENYLELKTKGQEEEAVAQDD